MVIVLLVLGLNVLGDGLRDVFDPRLKGLGERRPRPRRQASEQLCFYVKVRSMSWRVSFQIKEGETLASLASQGAARRWQRCR